MSSTVIDAWRDALGGEDVLERRDLEILAYMPISVEETTGAVNAALRASGQ